jgi:hypothetical protein
VAQVDWPYGNVSRIGQTPKLEVIRGQRDFIVASGMAPDGKTRGMLEKFLLDSFRVKSVNFDSQMLLVVWPGVQPNGVNHVVVTRLMFHKDSNVLKVHWALRPRPPGQPVPSWPRFPAALVMLNRFDGEVTLDPQPDS